MATRIETLVAALQAARGDNPGSVTVALGEVTLVVGAEELEATMRMLRDKPEFRFETLIDLCGVDYSTWGDPGDEPARNGPHDAPCFAAVYHLISLANNWRLRVRAFAADNAFPVLPTMVDVWPGANWYEREAFDLYGIMFAGHPDLRRLLTDYGFIGHPFRKDFPVTGHVEMRFDPEQARVIYQPVTIEPRVITPRIIREKNYADTE